MQPRDESQDWLAALTPRAPGHVGDTEHRPRILWADDNADTRHYVNRLLGKVYEVQTVPDGEAALEAARSRPPDLVLSDVMMPRLDGLRLVNALRANPGTRSVPIILLSARAGEESCVEGLEAGADDYMINPFSARELLARIGTHLKMARIRRESEQQLTRILESITEAFQVFDADWRITYMNPVARKIFASHGIDPDAMFGKHLWEDLFPESRDSEAARHVFRAMTERVPVAFESYYAPWGMWQRCRFDPLPDGGLANFFQDITDSKRAEEDLRRSEERFRRCFELGLVGMAITSPTKDCIEVNDEMCKILGYSRDEMLRMTWAEMTHPDDLAADVANFERVLNGEVDGYVMDKRLVRKDGRVIDTTISVKCLRHEDGSVDYFVAMVQDVTERNLAERALRESKEQMAADLAGMKRLQEVSTRLVHDGDSPSLLPEIVDAAIAITAADMGNIQLFDPDSGALKIEASRGFEAPFLEFFGSVHDSQSACGTAMRAGERVVVEDVATSPVFAGNPARDVMLAAGARAVQSTPLFGRSGQLVGMLSTHYRTPRRPADRDLHVLDLLARQAADWIERAQSDEALRLAKDAAEAANRAKDEFLANVSHELRTPFGAILGMTELVLDSPLTEDQRQCLETVKAAADSLLGVLNDMLDFSKIEAGKLALDPAEFSLRATLSEVLRIVNLRAQSKGLELVDEVDHDAPDALVGDPGRLRQVLLNLIGNAIKFTREGRVAVRVEGVDANALDGEAVLRFTVTDTGIGIPPEGRERIFQAFEQADSSTTRRFGGTGLGLTIAARLVGLMGGAIGVESEPGRGSTFSFTARFGMQPYPRDRVAAQPPSVSDEAATPTPVAAPLRILVAEDSEFNSRHLERLLARQGHAVRLAPDGREALKLLGEAAFDLLLLDLHMPELDGFQVAHALRQRELATGGHLPVIALTARARKEDRESCLAAGMDDYLSKPVRTAELFAAIDRAVAGVGSTPPKAGGGASLLDPATLLAACDGHAEGLRELCQDFLAYAPARLSEVSDALQARDAPRLREAAHKLCGLLSAFSTLAGDVASDLEHHAALGQLDEGRPLVARLEIMVQELIPEVDNVSYENLRRQAEPTDDPGRTAGA